MKSRCKTCDNRGEETIVGYWRIAKPVGATAKWWGLLGRIPRGYMLGRWLQSLGTK